MHHRTEASRPQIERQRHADDLAPHQGNAAAERRWAGAEMGAQFRFDHRWGGEGAEMAQQPRLVAPQKLADAEIRGRGAGGEHEKL
jgi:hypothetical protein